MDEPIRTISTRPGIELANFGFLKLSERVAIRGVGAKHISHSPLSLKAAQTNRNSSSASLAGNTDIPPIFVVQDHPS